MSENVSALLEGAEPPCKACQESAGLCHSCAERDRSILPQLAQEAWHKDAHSGPLGKNPPPVVEIVTTPEERKERKKAARAKHRAAMRLKIHLAGGLTCSRSKVA